MLYFATTTFVVIGVLVRTLVYYLATSLDGFIADQHGDFSAFPLHPETLTALFTRYPETCPVHLRAPLGITAPPTRFDTVLMGRKTHQPAIDAGLADGAYPHLEQYVVTHRPFDRATAVQAITEDPLSFVRRLKRRPGRDIWLCGGADVAHQLIEEIDEIQLKINPVLLGRGIPVLLNDGEALQLDLADSEQLPGGILLATYRRRRQL